MTNTDPKLLAASRALSAFTQDDLTHRVASLEDDFRGATADTVRHLLADCSVSHELLAGARVVKDIAGQINVVIHAIGILLCLPHVLDADEQILSLSLGAGNTGRAFDLETNRRIAEFKFIHWRGGAETIRQNALFKDLYQMVEFDTSKHRSMYVLGTHYPMKFLNSKRALSSIMSRNRPLWDDFVSRYGDSMTTVADYYALKKSAFTLVDVRPYIPALASSSSNEVYDRYDADTL